jgi:hypothetical protein
MLGTQFTVFDNGHSPKDKERNSDENSLRREMVAVAYVGVVGLALIH